MSHTYRTRSRWLSIRCLTPNADERPDIVEVSSRISDIMMKFVDSLCASHNSLERRAERDRKRAQKYFLESNRTRMCIPLHQVWTTGYFFSIIICLSDNKMIPAVFSVYFVFDSEHWPQRTRWSSSITDSEFWNFYICFSKWTRTKAKSRWQVALTSWFSVKLCIVKSARQIHLTRP